jgi:hypothetical protein
MQHPLIKEVLEELEQFLLMLNADSYGLDEFAYKHVGDNEEIIIEFADKIIIVAENEIIEAVGYDVEILVLPECFQRVDLARQFRLLLCSLSNINDLRFQCGYFELL